MRKIAAIMVALAGVATLSACDSEPSAADIQAAMQADADKTSAGVAGLVGGNQNVKNMVRVEIEKVQKLGCVKDGPGYRCDIIVEREVPIVGDQTENTSVRLSKGDAGWVVMRN